MRHVFWHIYRASRETFADRIMLAVFIALWMVLFSVMFTIPVRATPGSSAALQAQIFGAGDYFVLLALSFLSALSLAIQINVFRQKFASASSATMSGAGIASALVSSVFASASCAFCVSALFGFLGFGAVLVLLQYRWHIVGAAFLLLVISLYFASRRLNDGCELCSTKT